MNVFCCTNPIKILEGLWQLFARADCIDYSDTIIFMPSNRSIQAFQKMIVEKTGGSVLLPKFVPLGTGDDDTEEPVPKSERVFSAAKKIREKFGYDFANSIQISDMLIRMNDYIDTEEVPWPDWKNIMPENFSKQFSMKAQMLDLIKSDELTDAKKRVSDIRGWIDTLKQGGFGRVFACGSTGSIPATRDLLTHIAKMPGGAVILPGKITKMPVIESEGYPYWAQAKLLQNIGLEHHKVGLLDTGKSDVDFLNSAFISGHLAATNTAPKLIECERESHEMDAVAGVVKKSFDDGKSVLVISPDVSASFRLIQNLSKMGLEADLSIGQPATALPLSKLILSIMEVWTNPNDRVINTIGILKHKLTRHYPDLDKFIRDNFRDVPGRMDYFYKLDPAFFEFLTPPKSDFANRLISAVEYITDMNSELFSDENKIVWETLVKASGDTASEFKAVYEYILGGEKIRTRANPNAKISVLGTIEARMIYADVAIICGLNEGMFPKKGFEFPWLGASFAQSLGLPSAARKAGLMALDFINLSCAPEVFWTRSKIIGHAPAIQSRFLSRMEVADRDNKIVRELYRPEIPEFIPMLMAAPRPPAFTGAVYATHLDTLFHNPFEFYAKHILNLRPMEDIRTEANAKDYGVLVHSVIEESGGNLAENFAIGAKKLIPENAATLYFWNKRFAESIDIIQEILAESPGAKTEVLGQAAIEGRIVKARADRIYGGVVMDIKTGAAPTEKSLAAGNAPQLPITAYILEMGGFGEAQKFEKMVFIDLKKNKIKSYPDPAIIIKTVEKCRDYFARLAHDGAEYIFIETGDAKYHSCDHLYRIS